MSSATDFDEEFFDDASLADPGSDDLSETSFGSSVTVIYIFNFGSFQSHYLALNKPKMLLK